MINFDAINDATGFAEGDKFENADQVRDYFTTENMEQIFEPFAHGDKIPTQDELNEMANAVIENGWHMRESM